MGKKIWEGLEVGQSCTIFGFVDTGKKIIPKGRVVVEQIELWYKRMHVGEGDRRRYVFRGSSVGGPIAHPIFSYEYRVVDNEPRYTIWRYQ